jgi:hypothetical protein
MKLAADDVQSVVIPGTGHYCLEEAPDEMLAALTAFLAPTAALPEKADPPRRRAGGRRRSTGPFQEDDADLQGAGRRLLQCLHRACPQ